MMQPTTSRRTKASAIVLTGGGRMIDLSLERLLRQHAACDVITAMHAGTLLLQLKKRPVPLVICDDTSPSLRSFALIGDIKALSAQTRVALIVPSGSADQERRATAAGADVYVPYGRALRLLPSIIDDLLA